MKPYEFAPRKRDNSPLDADAHARAVARRDLLDRLRGAHSRIRKTVPRGGRDSDAPLHEPLDPFGDPSDILTARMSDDSDDATANMLREHGAMMDRISGGSMIDPFGPGPLSGRRSDHLDPEDSPFAPPGSGVLGDHERKLRKLGATGPLSPEIKLEPLRKMAGGTMSTPAVPSPLQPASRDTFGTYKPDAPAPTAEMDDKGCCEATLEQLKKINDHLQHMRGSGGMGGGGGGAGGGGGRGGKEKDREEEDRRSTNPFASILRNLGLGGKDTNKLVKDMELMGLAGNNQQMMAMGRALTGDPFAMAQVALNAVKSIGEGTKQAAGHVFGAMHSDKAEDVLGGAADAMDSFMDGLDKAAGGMGLLKNPMTDLATGVLRSVGAVRKWSESLHANNMRFAEVSSTMAGVEARQEVRDIKLAMERGARRSETAEELAKSKNRADVALARVEDRWANAMNRLSSTANDMLTFVAVGVEENLKQPGMGGFGPLLKAAGVPDWQIAWMQAMMQNGANNANNDQLFTAMMNEAGANGWAENFGNPPPANNGGRNNGPRNVQ